MSAPHSQHSFSLSPAPAAGPPPPPKPASTPLSGPPLPPPPAHSSRGPVNGSAAASFAWSPGNNPARDEGAGGTGHELPEEGWLPVALKDKSTVDLQSVLQDPPLQNALVHSADTTHPCLPASTASLQQLLAANLSLANSLLTLEAHLKRQREGAQSRLLALRGLERQWRAKQAEQDAALRDFSPPALYQQLSAAVAEQEALCRGLKESFLEGDGGVGGDGGVATEREVMDFVKRIREGRKIAYLRRERKERWDEGRVGGWR